MIAESRTREVECGTGNWVVREVPIPAQLSSSNKSRKWSTPYGKFGSRASFVRKVLGGNFVLENWKSKVTDMQFIKGFWYMK